MTYFGIAEDSLINEMTLGLSGNRRSKRKITLMLFKLNVTNSDYYTWVENLILLRQHVLWIYVRKLMFLALIFPRKENIQVLLNELSMAGQRGPKNFIAIIRFDLVPNFINAVSSLRLFILHRLLV